MKTFHLFSSFSKECTFLHGQCYNYLLFFFFLTYNWCPLIGLLGQSPRHLEHHFSLVQKHSLLASCKHCLWAQLERAKSWICFYLGKKQVWPVIKCPHLFPQKNLNLKSVLCYFYLAPTHLTGSSWNDLTSCVLLWPRLPNAGFSFPTPCLTHMVSITMCHCCSHHKGDTGFPSQQMRKPTFT